MLSFRLFRRRRTPPSNRTIRRKVRFRPEVETCEKRETPNVLWLPVGMPSLTDDLHDITASDVSNDRVESKGTSFADAEATDSAAESDQISILPTPFNDSESESAGRSYSSRVQAQL